MAEAFFNQLSRGPALALSAGTEPGSGVNPVVVEAMREVGLDISSNMPKRLTPEMLDDADMVVTMGCGAEGVCPASFVETQDWDLEDPVGQPLEKVREILEEIRVRVANLLSAIDQ
jgi:arsenate reductase